MQHLYESGFTDAVHAYHAELFAGSEGVGEVVENHFVAEALAYTFGLEYFGAYARRCCVEPHVPLCAGGAGALLEVVEVVDAEFGLSGTCLRLSAHPVLLLAESVSGARHIGGHGLDALGAAAQVHVVVAFDFEHGAVVQLYNLRAYAVEEVAVVRNHEECGSRASEVAFEPFDSAYVEVVGRLVED